METTTDSPRAFRLPLRSIMMSERRIMARQFGVNWDAVELEMGNIPQPVDRDDPTDDEKLAIAEAFVRIVGPIEKFALLFVAVKRQMPAVTEAEVERHADAGDWVLDLSSDVDPEVSDDPLPPPDQSSNTSS